MGVALSATPLQEEGVRESVCVYTYSGGGGNREGSQTEKLGLLQAGLRPQIFQDSAFGSGPEKEFERNWELHPGIVVVTVGEVRVAGNACARC